MAMKVHESIVYELVHNLEFRKQFLLALDESGVEFAAEFPGEQPIPDDPQGIDNLDASINEMLCIEPDWVPMAQPANHEPL